MFHLIRLLAGFSAAGCVGFLVFSLKRVVLEAKRIWEREQSSESLSLFDRLGSSFELWLLQAEATA